MRGYKTQATRVEITGSKYEGGQLLVSGNGLAGQKFENLPWHDPLGFHSRPKKGDIAYLHSPGGNGDKAIVTAAFEAGKVPELQEGERAMYDGGSNVVKLTSDGWEFNAKVKIMGDLEITGSFSAGGGISLDGDINAGGNGTFGGVVTDVDGDGGA